MFCWIIQRTDCIAKDPVKLRVKRGFEYDCFVEKFSKSWAKKMMSNNLIIDYVGEAGIDDGGQEIFSVVILSCRQGIL